MESSSSVKGFEGLLITLTKFQEKLSLKALFKKLLKKRPNS